MDAVRVFVTQYALTEGIREYDVRPSGVSPDMVVLSRAGQHDLCFHGEGKDWHRTFEGAKARAELMRKRRIAGYKKSIARLEALSFEKPMSILE